MGIPFLVLEIIGFPKMVGLKTVFLLKVGLPFRPGLKTLFALPQKGGYLFKGLPGSFNPQLGALEKGFPFFSGKGTLFFRPGLPEVLL